MRSAILFLVVILAAVPSQAQNSGTVQAFDEGTRLLEEGAYAAAIARFDEVEEGGFISAPLLYNRALARFRTDALGLAIRDFERARRLDPGNELIVHSLGIAQARIDRPISRLPKSFSARLWQWFSRSPWLLFGLGAAAYLLFILVSIAAVRRLGSAEWLRRGRWLFGGAAAFLITTAFVASAFPPLGHQAVVTAPETAVFAQADPTAERMELLSEGITVRVEREEGAWLLVRLPNGVQGWLAVGTVASI